MQKKLSVRQKELLEFIRLNRGEKDLCPMGKILDELGRTPSNRASLSRSLRRLETRGLIERYYSMAGHWGAVRLSFSTTGLKTGK